MNCKNTFLVFLLLLSITELKAQLQWEGIEVNASYHLYTIAAADDQVIYTGGYGGSLLKSSDGGNTWQNLNSGSTDWVSDMHFFDAQNGWICSQAQSDLDSGQVQKTSDGGQTWTTVRNFKNYLCMNWVNPSVGYVGAWYGYMEKTTDGGQTWTTLTLPTSGTIADIEFVDENTGYFITTDYKLCKTTDGGMNWNLYSHPYIESIFFLDANTGYCTTYTGKIGKTTDGGITYTYTQSPYGFKINDVLFRDAQIGYAVGGLDCSSGNCTQSPILLTTTDGGQTWIDNSHPYVNMARGFFQVSLTPSGKPFVAGSNKIVLQQVTTASVNALTPVEQITINPNPATTQIGISVPDEAVLAVISDLSGKTLETHLLTPGLEATIQTDALSSGAYLLTLFNQAHKPVATGKFLK